MKLYLVRHGEAISSLTDPASPLSPQGKLEVLQVGNLLAKLSQNIATICHSSKLRAHETAHLIASSIAFTGEIKQIKGLEPNDDIFHLIDLINMESQEVCYVGHMPFMAKLVSQLVHKNEFDDTIIFNTSTMICLEKQNATDWKIMWILNPEFKVNSDV